jgi:hypothetical protein
VIARNIRIRKYVFDGSGWMLDENVDRSEPIKDEESSCAENKSFSQVVCYSNNLD